MARGLSLSPAASRPVQCAFPETRRRTRWRSTTGRRAPAGAGLSPAGCRRSPSPSWSSPWRRSSASCGRACATPSGSPYLRWVTAGLAVVAGGLLVWTLVRDPGAAGAALRLARPRLPAGGAPGRSAGGSGTPRWTRSSGSTCSSTACSPLLFERAFRPAPPRPPAARPDRRPPWPWSASRTSGCSGSRRCGWATGATCCSTSGPASSGTSSPSPSRAKAGGRSGPGAASRRLAAGLGAVLALAAGAFFDTAHLGYEIHDPRAGSFVSLVLAGGAGAAAAERRGAAGPRKAGRRSGRSRSRTPT